MKKIISLFIACAAIIFVSSVAFAETAFVAAPATVTIDLTGIAIAVLTCLIGFIFKKVSPLLNNSIGKAIAMTACYAAEQLYKTGVIQDRLAYATEYLAQHGITVNARELIEAVVGEMNVAKSIIETDTEVFDDGEEVEDEEQSESAE